MQEIFTIRERIFGKDLKMVSRTRGVEDFQEGFTSRALDSQTGRISSPEIIRKLATCQGRFANCVSTEQFPFFLWNSDITISSEAYELLHRKQPFTVETDLTSVGTSSFAVQSNLILTTYPQQTLAVCRSVAVAVDIVARKSIPLPASYLERFKDLRNQGHQTRPEVVKLDKPEGSLVCQGYPTTPSEVQVARRHVDGNGHTNFIAYVEYCIDILELHIREDQTCLFNTGSLLLKKGQFAFKGESSTGDILQVAFWDDKGDNSTVCFDISNVGLSVFQTKMQFHGKDVLGQHDSKL